MTTSPAAHQTATVIFDESSSAISRSARRRVRARRAAFTMAGGSAASLAVGLAIVPLTVGYLGESRFGLLAATIAAAALLEPIDLGIGSALVTLVGSATAPHGKARTAQLVRTAAKLAAGIGLILAVVGFASPLLVSWPDVFNATSLGSAATRSVLVLIAAAALGLPLSLVDRINLGLQHGDRVGVTTVVGWLLSLAGVVAVASRHGDVPWLLAAYLGGPLVARWGAAVLLVVRWLPEVRESHDPDRATVWSLVHTGRLFFVLQLAVAVAYTSDQLVVARVVGLDAVPDYAIGARLFGVVTAGAALLVRPLWPAYAEAGAAGDVEWIRSTLHRSIRMVFFGSVTVGVVLLVVGPRLIGVLSHDVVNTDRGLLVPFAVWGVIMATGNAVAMALNGLAVVRMQVIVASTMAVTNLILSISLAHVFGAAGVLWGSVIAYLGCVGLPYARFVARLGRLESP